MVAPPQVGDFVGRLPQHSFCLVALAARKYQRSSSSVSNRTEPKTFIRTNSYSCVSAIMLVSDLSATMEFLSRLTSTKCLARGSTTRSSKPTAAKCRNTCRHPSRRGEGRARHMLTLIDCFKDGSENDKASQMSTKSAFERVSFRALLDQKG